MSTPVLLACLLLAFLLGYAIRRGGICAVAAVEQVLDGKGPGLFIAFLKCSLWALLLATPALWLLARHGPTEIFAATWMSFLGGAVFGIGAAANGACAFATFARLGSGDTTYLGTMAGMAAGFAGVTVLGDVPPRPIGQSPLAVPDTWALALLAGLACWAAWEVWRLARCGGFRPRPGSMAWDPAAATLIIGACGGLLFALEGPWVYTTVLEHAFHFRLSDRWVSLVLAVAVLAGAALAAGHGRRWRLNWSAPGFGRRVLAGSLMGLGAALVPGGNDALLLHAAPSLSPHTLSGYTGLVVGIAVALIAGRRLRARS